MGSSNSVPEHGDPRLRHMCVCVCIYVHVCTVLLKRVGCGGNRLGFKSRIPELGSHLCHLLTV